MRKLKIMLLANDTTYTYNLRYEILERLISDGNDVVLVTQLLNYQEELKHMGCRLINIETKRHGKNPFSDIQLLFYYIKILKQEKPDVVLTYNIKPNVYGGMACRFASIHYFPNITGLGTAVEYPGLMQMITTRLYKVGIYRADCIFFQNEENKRFFIERHMLREDCRTRLLPGSGVSLKFHKPLPYPEDGKHINFLFVARIMKEKGIELYLNAAKRIYEQHKNVTFHICGRCDDRKYIEVLYEAEANGYIKYHGEQKDIVPFFKMAHCIVHPSYYPEGMSNVLLEACATGRPIITTDRSGCREVVDDNRNGYMIPQRNGVALVKAIEKFLDLSLIEKKQMGKNARAKVEKEFDRKIVVDQYLEEIKRISE